MSTAPQPVATVLDRAHEALLRRMPEPLQPIAREGCAIQRAAFSSHVLSHYRLGRLAWTALRDEHKHGHNTIRDLASAWNLSTQHLGKLIAFAQGFDESFVAEWSAKLLRIAEPDTPRYLTLSHWLLIVGNVEDHRERVEVVAMIVRDSLATTQLLAYLKRRPGRRRAGGGRHFTKPSSLIHGLIQFTDKSDKLARWEKEVFDGVLEHLGCLSAPKVDADIIMSVKDAIRAASETAETSTATLRELESVLQRLESLAKHNGQGPNGEEPNGKEPAAKAPRGAGRAAKPPAEETDDEFAEPVGIGARRK
jgi:hypothetical protein